MKRTAAVKHCLRKAKRGTARRHRTKGNEPQMAMRNQGTLIQRVPLQTLQSRRKRKRKIEGEAKQRLQRRTRKLVHLALERVSHWWWALSIGRQSYQSSACK